MTAWALPTSDLIYLVYLTVFATATVGCLFGAWRAQETAPPDVRLSLTGLLGTSGLWAGTNVGILLSSSLWLKTNFYQAGLIVGFSSVLSWLWLCSAYSGRSLHRNRTVRWATCILLATVSLAKLTNDWHGLYFSTEWGTVPFPHLHVDHHVLYWITASVSWTLAGVGFFMLIEPLRRIEVGTEQLAGFFGLAALPLGINAIGYASPWLLNLTHEPLGVAIFALGVFYTYDERLEKVGRTARQKRPALILSEENRVQNYNERATHLFPVLQRTGAVGKPVAEVLPELAEVLSNQSNPESGTRAEEVLEIESSSLQNDGGPRYFWPIRTALRAGQGWLVVLSDVTEAEHGRRDREARLTALFEQSPDMVEVRDLEGNLLQANPRFFEETGYQEDDLTEMKVWDLDEPIGPQASPQMWAEMEVGDRRRLERTYRRKDGSTFPVEVHIRRLRLNGEDRFMVISRDISERKQAERALQEERDRLETLFESLPTPVVRARLDGDATTITNANAAFEDTFGHARQDVEGQPLNTLLVSANQQEEAAEIDRRAVEEGPLEKEVQRIAADGPRDFQLQVAGRQRKGPRPDEIYAIYTDITNQKEQEQNLREAKGRYQALIENFPDGGVFLFDDDLRYTLAGGQELSEVGLSPSDIEGNRPHDLFPAPLVEEIVEYYRRALNGEANVYEQRYQGSHYRIHTLPVRDESGTVISGMAVSQNITERKQRVRHLKRQERLIENLPVGVFRTTLSGEIVDLNAALAEMCDTSESELRRTGAEAFYPESTDREVLLKRLQEEGQVEGEILRMQTAQNEELLCQVTISLVEEDGEQYLDGIIQDVTERRRRKKRLERQNDLFERAQEIAKVGAWEYNVQEQKLTATKQTYLNHGLTPDDDLTPERSHELYHPEDQSRAQEAFRRAIERGASYDIEARLITEAGDERWVRTRGEPQLEDGEIVRVRGTLQDITERKERERALRDRQAKIEGLYETADRLLKASTEDEVAKRLIRLIRETLGYRGVSVRIARDGFLEVQEVSVATFDFMPERPDFQIDGESAVAEAYRTGETLAIDDLESIEIDDPNDYGNLRSVIVVPMGKHGTLAVASPEPEAIGAFDRHMIEVLGTYGTAVLGRLGREQALRAAKENAEAASRAKSTFLANMSHEIRTPLTSIIGFAGALGDEVETLQDCPDQADLSTLMRFSTLIEQGGTRLMDTLDGVLNLSKLEAGEMGLEAKPVNLGDQIQQVAEELRPQAQDKNIRLHVEMGDAAPFAEADAGGVQIILQNLVSNAIKYTDDGGAVWVRAYQEEDQAVLEVEDTGIGMSPEIVEQIFEPFQQATEGTKREYEGTGVGLAVTRKATKQMGGALEVETEEGEGSRFTVRLPSGEPTT